MHRVTENNNSSSDSNTNSSECESSIHGDTPGWSDNEYNPFGQEAIATRKRDATEAGRYN